MFIISELIACLNFLNILLAYLRSDRQFLVKFTSVHLAIVQLPLIVLLFDILRNGAIALSCQDFMCRIFANVFIWFILIIRLFLIFVLRDLPIGLALAYQMFSMGIEQLSKRLFLCNGFLPLLLPVFLQYFPLLYCLFHIILWTIV